jgi:hypothetical protein
LEAAGELRLHDDHPHAVDAAAAVGTVGLMSFTVRRRGDTEIPVSLLARGSVHVASTIAALHVIALSIDELR